MAKQKTTAKDAQERPSVVARQFIEAARQSAKERGDSFVELVSGEVHKALNWKSRLPLVCDAMKNSMRLGDRVIHTTPSGKSSTITIRYYTDERVEVKPSLATIAENQTNFSEEFSRLAETKICRERSRILHTVVSVTFCFLSAMIGFVVARAIFSRRED
ncbi:MAG: hypothetical protein WCV63_04925 [Negativicutes bacterium]|jgi:hypothetical protein